jgi:MFS transporter, ACS family, tartrate transporter
LLLTGTGAAVGFALINSIGNLGGFMGPSLMGYFWDVTGSYKEGMFFLGLIVLAGGMTAWLLKFSQSSR